MTAQPIPGEGETVALEVFNTNYKLRGVMAPLSQDEIYNTPEFYAMSADEIVASGRCPSHLRRVLEAMEWTGRPNFVQVRPQDFRAARPYVLGDGWHVDLNTQVKGRMHLAKSLDEFRSMVVSFGDVVETEFVARPFSFDTAKASPYDHSPFAEAVKALHPETVALKPNQLAVYTSRDVHRVSPNLRPGNMRLIIVTVETDVDNQVGPGEGEIRPSIREREVK
jgi:hypothetical protein